MILRQYIILPGIFFALSVFSQKPPEYDIKAITNRFPEEKLISVSEAFNYTFLMTEKGKKSEFSIAENYSSLYFTTEPDYSKLTSIFYDDYSKVGKLQYKVNKSPFTGFPVVHTNYESEGIFHDDVKICAFNVNMKQGNLYEVNYEKIYHNPRLFTRVYFHTGHPIHKKTLCFEVPDWLELELKEVNFEGYTVKRREEALPLKKTKKIIYEMSDIDAIPQESHSPGMSKYLPHLLIFVKSYNYKNNSAKFFGTHADLYSWCKTLVDSVDNDPESLKPVFYEIVKNEPDSFRTMEKIFYWVQDHVRYIAFENGIMGYKPMAATKVCNMLYGDCKGMANLTKNLLKLAGIDARLTWIGTSDIPYHNDLPTLVVYNHMICTAILGGKKYFLDATEDYIAIDDYAERIQGRPVMIENGATYLDDKIPLLNYERNRMEETDEVWVEANLLKGKSKVNCDGETKTGFLRGIAAMKTENRELAMKNYLKSGNNNVKIKSCSTSNLTERTKPLEINYDYELSNSVFKASSKEMLIMPVKDMDFQNLSFDSTRKNDYVFNHRYYISYKTKINLPAGATVKDLPAAVTVKNDNYEFDLHYEKEGGSVILVKKIIVKNVILKRSQFMRWNEDVRLVKQFYNSGIILKTS